MDTIIYLYRWKQPEEWAQLNRKKMYCREDFEMPDYHLIKVGMTPQLLQICGGVSLSDACKERKWGPYHRWYLKKQRKQEKRLLMDFWQDLASAETAKTKALPAQDVTEFKDCCFVCEESVPCFAAWYFNGYFEVDWVRHMLRYGGLADNDSLLLSHIVILGQAECVSEVISVIARNLKSLQWILPTRQFREEQQELTDELSEEYGLAAQVRLLSEEESYKQVYPVCRVPSLVLDFSEADRIPTADVARGSIWLDMASCEEKRRRIEDRDTGIHYYSLKKEWKQPQKALNYLDTIGKNGYNT